jgi:hypothetical protein
MVTNNLINMLQNAAKKATPSSEPQRTTNNVPYKIKRLIAEKTPRRYPYFDVVVGLAWSHDPKSYAGSSVCYW